MKSVSCLKNTIRLRGFLIGGIIGDPSNYLKSIICIGKITAGVLTVFGNEMSVSRAVNNDKVPQAEIPLQSTVDIVVSCVTIVLQ